MRQRKQRIQKLAEAVRRGFDLPEGLPGGAGHLELNGNTEAVLEGCLGVLEYDDDAVAFSVGALTVRLRGAGLTIVSFQDGIAVVHGTFLAIEYGT